MMTRVTSANQVDAYTMSPTLPEPADFELSQHTTTPEGEHAYDDAGNLVQVSGHGGWDAAYDYANRMVSLDGATGVQATYRYDALGRRIARTVTNQGHASTTQYAWYGSRVLEERSGNGELQAEYVYGTSAASPLQMRRGGSHAWYVADDQASTRALTDDGGSVVERYDYDDYGAPSILGRSGDALTASALGNPYLYAGRPWDAESGLYYFRTRYLDPADGRFTTRDSIGIWGDVANLGNGYAYTGNNPHSRVDPTGMGTEEGDPGSFVFRVPGGREFTVRNVDGLLDFATQADQDD